PDYGPVWIPQVSPGWAPYRYGHWAYVEPWGWTWIDDAPWGFTPFHYGRWIEYDDEWAWVPGAFVAAPVYAPAVVSFFGDFGSVGGGVGFGFGSVGWIPLGPEEVFRPWFPCSRLFVRNVNIANVQNVTVISNNTVVNNFGWDRFRNHRGGTFVSADVMTHSRPVDPAFRQMPHDRLQRAWSHARPLDRGGVLRPTFPPAGVTPALVHRLGLVGGPNRPAFRPAAPGPSFAGQRFQAQRFGWQNRGPGLQNRGAPLPALSQGQRPGGQFGRPATLPNIVRGNRPNLPPLATNREWQNGNRGFAQQQAIPRQGQNPGQDANPG